MASGHSKWIPPSNRASALRTQRVQELKKKFEEDAQKEKAINESRGRGQTSRRISQGPGTSSGQTSRRISQSPRPSMGPINESGGRGQTSRRISQGPAHSRGPVQTMRRKFEGPAAASQKQGPNYKPVKRPPGSKIPIRTPGRDQGPRAGLQGTMRSAITKGSVQDLRKIFDPSSQKSISGPGSQGPGPSGLGRQGAGPSGQVQSMRHKFEPPPDKSPGSSSGSTAQSQGSRLEIPKIQVDDYSDTQPPSQPPSYAGASPSGQGESREPEPQPSTSSGASGVSRSSNPAVDWMLENALSSAIGIKKPNPQEARTAVQGWYELFQQLLQQDRTIDDALRTYEREVTNRDRLASECEEVEGEIQNMIHDTAFKKELIDNLDPKVWQLRAQFNEIYANNHDLRVRLREGQGTADAQGGPSTDRQSPVRQQDESHLSTPRSRRSSGYQASSPAGSDSSHGGPQRRRLRTRRRALADIHDADSTASPEVPQRSGTQRPGSSRRPAGGDSHSSGSQATTRGPSPMTSPNERQAAGYYHSDLDDFIATRKIEPRANTSGARWEERDDWLRNIRRERGEQTSSEAYSTAEGSHHSEDDHTPDEDDHTPDEDDHTPDDDNLAPHDDYQARPHPPDMLGRVWNAREMGAALGRINAQAEPDSSRGSNAQARPDSSRGSPDRFQEQSTSSGVSDIPNQAPVRSPDPLGRLWNPRDLNLHIQRFQEQGSGRGSPDNFQGPSRPASQGFDISPQQGPSSGRSRSIQEDAQLENQSMTGSPQQGSNVPEEPGHIEDPFGAGPSPNDNVSWEHGEIEDPFGAGPSNGNASWEHGEIEDPFAAGPSSNRNAASPPMRGFFDRQSLDLDNLDLGSGRFSGFPSEGGEHTFESRDTSTDMEPSNEFIYIDIDSPPPFALPSRFSLSPTVTQHMRPEEIEEYVRNAQPPDLPDEDFQRSIVRRESPTSRRFNAVEMRNRERPNQNDASNRVSEGEGPNERRPNLNETYTIMSGSSHRSMQSPRSQPQSPVADLNRRWGPDDFNQHPSFGGSSQSSRHSNQQHDQSHSRQESPRPQLGQPLPDLNRRWNPNDFNQQLNARNREPTMEEQFAMWAAGRGHQN